MTTQAIRQEFWAQHPLVYSVLSHPEWNDLGAVSQAARGLFARNGRFNNITARRTLSRLESVGFTVPAVPAGVLDAHDIPNGRYALVTDEYNFYYKVHTVQSGRWAGRRIVKFHDPDNPRDDGYAAFAFLNCDGSLTLWSRFEDRLDRIFTHASLMLRMVQRWHADYGQWRYVQQVVGEQVTDSYADGGMSLRIELSCRSCNTFDRGITERWHCPTHTLIDGAEETEEGSYEAENVRNLALCEVTGTEIR